MASKWVRSGSTLIEMPWNETQRRNRTPIAAILSSKPAPLSGRSHPDADAILAPFASHVEGRQRPDDPLLEPRHIGPYIRPPPLQVEHDIGHPLAGAVIGELAAAAGIEQRKAGIEQVGRPCRWCRRCRAEGAPAARPVPARCRPRSPRPAPPWPRWPRDRAPARRIPAIRPHRRRRRAQNAVKSRLWRSLTIG